MLHHLISFPSGFVNDINKKTTITTISSINSFETKVYKKYKTQKVIKCTDNKYNTNREYNQVYPNK